MLVSSQKLLKDARNGGYAIGAFNTNNLEFTQAIIAAAEKLRAPVIVQTSTKSLEYAGVDELLGIIRSLGEKAAVPVVVHLDHGKDPKLVRELIEKQLHTSVMFDGSVLPYEDNVATTKELAILAHERNISIEAELGTIGGREDYVANEVSCTDPDQAADFVARTGCDSLAVAIGNVHGEKIKGEKLRFDILEAIAQKVTIPLVLHGSSNSTNQEFHRAIELGIAKINIDTELRQAFSKEDAKYAKDHPKEIDPRTILGATRDAVQRVVEKRIADFGAAGKAK
jgi:fructose-bisphosphate aldolase class II